MSLQKLKEKQIRPTDKQKNKTELSAKAQKWLSDHGFTKKAENIREYSRWLEFTTRTDRPMYVTLHTVTLSNGDWGTRDVHIKSLRENW